MIIRWTCLNAARGHPTSILGHIKRPPTNSKKTFLSGFDTLNYNRLGCFAYKSLGINIYRHCGYVSIPKDVPKRILVKILSIPHE